VSDGGEDEEPDEQPPARPKASEGVRILGAEEAQAALDGGQVARRIGGDELRFGDVPDRPDPAVRPAARFPRPATPEDGQPSDEPRAAADDVADHTRAGVPTTNDGPDAAVREGLGELVAEVVEPSDQADRAFRDELDAIADDGGESHTASGGRRAGGNPSVVRRAGEEASGQVELPHWTEPPTGEIPIILPESEVIDDPAADGDLGGGPGVPGTPAPRFRSKVGDWSESDFAEAELLEDDADSLGAMAEVEDDDAEFAASVARRRVLPRRPRRADGGGPTDGGASVRPAPSRPPGPSGPGGRGREPKPEPEATEPPTSDLLTRVIVGVAVAVAALICLRLGRGATAVLVTVIIGLGTFEFYEVIRKRGFHPATILGLLAAVTTPLAAYKVGEAAFPLLIALLTVFTMLWFLARVVDARPLVGVAVTLLGYLYVGGLGGFAGLMLAFPNGVGLILGVALCAVAYDVAGYVIGSQFGKTPLALGISPNKTVEGLAAGMTASIVVAGIIVNRFSPWTDLGHALSLGLVVAIVAPLGDLCASMIKRDLKIKDFGTLLPGHGGILDRFDAILFCLPAVYYLARYLKIG